VQPRLAREQTDQRARAGACVEGVIVEPAQAGGTRHDVRAQGLQAAVARPRHGDRHRLHRRQFRQDQPRQRVAAGGPIWVSILGAAPFTLALPYADLFWTGVLSVVIGLVMSSAFSAIVVFAQELVPGKIGMIAGIFFGLMFGVSGIGAAAMGHIADVAGIETVYRLASFLPLLGVLAAFLPKIGARR
jgi:hypothetical protein